VHTRAYACARTTNTVIQHASDSTNSATKSAPPATKRAPLATKRTPLATNTSCVATILTHLRRPTHNEARRGRIMLSRRAFSTHSATKRAHPPPTRGVLPPSSRIRGSPRTMPPGSASLSGYATKKGVIHAALYNSITATSRDDSMVSVTTPLSIFFKKTVSRWDAKT
jgi:hypothetical protein